MLNQVVSKTLTRPVLPLINAGPGHVQLLDEPELLRELRGLERRLGSGGRDRVDHGPGAHDDRANSAAGVLTLLTARQPVECTGFPIGILKAEPWPQWAAPACGRYF